MFWSHQKRIPQTLFTYSGWKPTSLRYVFLVACSFISLFHPAHTVSKKFHLHNAIKNSNGSSNFQVIDLISSTFSITESSWYHYSKPTSRICYLFFVKMLAFDTKYSHLNQYLLYLWILRVRNIVNIFLSFGIEN